MDCCHPWHYVSVDSMFSLTTLAEIAEFERPRLFAMYGLRHDPDALPILGWGMEFQAQESTLFHLPQGPVTHHTVTADQIARRYARLGEMHLTWFTGDATRESAASRRPHD